MQEHTAAYVAREEKPALPAPGRETGPFASVRRNLFATPLDAVLTVLAGSVLVWAVWSLFQWAVVDAVFSGTSREACLVEGGGHGGACWAFVDAKFGQFLYGVYPLAERWRPNLVLVLLAVLAAGLLMPRVPHKRLNAMLLFAAFPFVALVLLTGGEFTLSGAQVAIILFVAAVATLARAASLPTVGFEPAEMRLAGWAIAAAALFLVLAYLTRLGSLDLLGVTFSVPSALALVALFAAIALAARAGTRGRLNGATAMRYATPLLLGLGLILLLTADFGLRPVSTNLWGGLLVTLVVALAGISASLPFGVVLALGRRSHMPAVRFFSIVFIEFWRGIPLISVLFMANFMLPLFLPTGVGFDQLLRIVVGITLFASAYMAEVIRGGLQAIPRGQYEGADAMALTYWQKMRLIILPQALKLVIPGIVNTFIGLFKDTSLVYIVGIADLLGAVRRGFNDPNWITPATPATGLVFAAFVYWLFCFSMSRYSLFVERRLETGHKR